MIRVKEGKFFLPPGFGLQMAVGMNTYLSVQKGLVQRVNIIRSDVDLPVDFLWVEVFKFKKMDLNSVFFYNKVPLSLIHI